MPLVASPAGGSGTEVCHERRSRDLLSSSQYPGGHSTQGVGIDMRRTGFAVQVLLLGTLVSATLAVASYYTSGVFGTRSPVICGIWGVLLGFPASALFVFRMNGEED